MRRRLRRGRSDAAADRHGRGRHRHDRPQLGQRRCQADHRLEELHRAGRARRDLRAGPRRGGLRGAHASSTSATRTRAQGGRARPDRRLPGVHRHRAAVVLRQEGRGAPQGPAGRLRRGQGRASRRDGIAALPPTPFTVLQRGRGDQGDRRQAQAQEHLRPARAGPQATLYGSPECRQRLDCLLGLEQVYGLQFKRFVPVAPPSATRCSTAGRADVSIVFTTDPQIKRDGEVLLVDDKGMFPPYNSTLV